MKIKVYSGCAVDGHNGVYTPMVFAQRYPENVSPGDLPILLAGPDHEDYVDVSAGDFIANNGNTVFEYNDSGDILTYELIDSDKITLKELNEYYTRKNFGRCIPVYECSYGYADIAQIGENCLCRVSIANVGIISADCFFEMDDYFSFDENLAAFCEELEETLKGEFEEDHDIFVLPAHFAAALINTDESGLSEEESQLLHDFVHEKCSGLCVGCSEDQFFTTCHDMPRIGASECLEFYFEKVSREI
jgi:hypothetical protein